MSNNKVTIIYTRQFPKPTAKNDGVFTYQAVLALQKKIDVIVVCPVPWCPKLNFFKRWPEWYCNADIPYEHKLNDLTVYYPKFPVVPLVTRVIQGLVQAIFVAPLIARLKKTDTVSLINAHCLYPDGIAAAILSKLFDIPVVLTALGTDINDDMMIGWKKKQMLWAMRNSRAITTKSHALKNAIVTAANMENKVFVVPNGIDVNRFTGSRHARSQAKLKLGLDITRQHLVFVGRLSEVKGVNHLFQALAILKKNELNFAAVIIGDGPLKGELEAYADANDLTASVTFAGTIAHDDVADWLKAADLLCLPSRMEGLPNVVMEALACGTPVVASNVGGIPELVNVKNGLLFRYGDAAELADKILLCLTREWSPAQIRETISWASWDHTAEQYINVYRNSI